MTKVQYQKMCYDVFNNDRWYRPISAYMVAQFPGQFKALLGVAFNNDLIDQDTYSFLNVQFPHDTTFYAIPKIHKKKANPLGRPIVSGIEAFTENSSRYVDFFLNVTGLPSYVRDTLDLLTHIEGLVVPPDALLVTVDVEALYSSIPQQQGIGVVKTFLMEQEQTVWQFNEFHLKLQFSS